MKIVIAGASGFVGQALARRLHQDGHDLVLLGSSRRPESPQDGSRHVAVAVGPLAAADPALLDRHLAQSDLVLHAAGRAHVFKEQVADPAVAFAAANEASVAALTAAMERQRVDRLVLISSIAAKLLRNEYGRSKRAGEQVAERWAAGSAAAAAGRRQLVVLRPPLIYGRGAPGNMARLMRLVGSGLPLPFASIDNRRSYLDVANLADAVARIAKSDAGAGSRCYEVCDDDVLSLPEVCHALGSGLGRRPRLLPFPATLLKATARRLAPSLEEGLFADLVLDASALRADYGWTPAISTRRGLADMAAHGAGKGVAVAAARPTSGAGGA